jgi:ribonuclease HII
MAKSNKKSATGQIRCRGTHERQAHAQGFRLVAGADEVGRGALFGPVFAGAVILSPDRPVRGLRDSKMLDPERREALAECIKDRAVAWSVGASDAFEIDRINIYQASRLAMKRAIERLSPAPDYILVDALRLDVDIPQQGLIKGDARVQAIAAASIIAKVHRDACMRSWHEIFPAYGLDSNKGYSTEDHIAALRRDGPTSLHRFSFQPVREASLVELWRGYESDYVQQSLFADQGEGALEMTGQAEAADLYATAGTFR